MHRAKCQLHDTVQQCEQTCTPLCQAIVVEAMYQHKSNQFTPHLSPVAVVGRAEHCHHLLLMLPEEAFAD
jgi:hypothetical protein